MSFFSNGRKWIFKLFVFADRKLWSTALPGFSKGEYYWVSLSRPKRLQRLKNNGPKILSKCKTRAPWGGRWEQLAEQLRKRWCRGKVCGTCALYRQFCKTACLVKAVRELPEKRKNCSKQQTLSDVDRQASWQTGKVQGASWLSTPCVTISRLFAGRSEEGKM